VEILPRARRSNPAGTFAARLSLSLSLSLSLELIAPRLTVVIATRSGGRDGPRDPRGVLDRLRALGMLLLPLRPARRSQIRDTLARSGGKRERERERERGRAFVTLISVPVPQAVLEAAFPLPPPLPRPAVPRRPAIRRGTRVGPRAQQKRLVRDARGAREYFSRAGQVRGTRRRERRGRKREQAEIHLRIGTADRPGRGRTSRRGITGINTSRNYRARGYIPGPALEAGPAAAGERNIEIEIERERGRGRERYPRASALLHARTHARTHAGGPAFRLAEDARRGKKRSMQERRGGGSFQAGSGGRSGPCFCSEPL